MSLDKAALESLRLDRGPDAGDYQESRRDGSAGWIVGGRGRAAVARARLADRSTAPCRCRRPWSRRPTAADGAVLNASGYVVGAAAGDRQFQGHRAHHRGAVRGGRRSQGRARCSRASIRRRRGPSSTVADQGARGRAPQPARNRGAARRRASHARSQSQPGRAQARRAERARPVGGRRGRAAGAPCGGAAPRSACRRSQVALSAAGARRSRRPRAVRAAS